MKRWRQDEQVIQGAGFIRFAAGGRVVYHRDCRDAAEELYGKLAGSGSDAVLRRQAEK